MNTISTRRLYVFGDLLAFYTLLLTNILLARSNGYPLVRSVLSTPATIDRYEELRRIRNGTTRDDPKDACYTCWLTNERVSLFILYRHKNHLQSSSV